MRRWVLNTASVPFDISKAGPPAEPTEVMPVAEHEAEVARLRDLCERAVDALRYEAHPVCDEWDALNEEAA